MTVIPQDHTIISMMQSLQGSEARLQEQQSYEHDFDHLLLFPDTYLQEEFNQITY